ncbi:MAG: hypothetical protein ACXVAW_18475 [Vulcanimicrobiaceae bacterium]
MRAFHRRFRPLRSRRHPFLVHRARQAGKGCAGVIVLALLLVAISVGMARAQVGWLQMHAPCSAPTSVAATSGKVYVVCGDLIYYRDAP